MDAPVRSNGLRTVWWLLLRYPWLRSLWIIPLWNTHLQAAESDIEKRNIFGLSKLCGKAAAHCAGSSPLISVNRISSILAAPCFPSRGPQHLLFSTIPSSNKVSMKCFKTVLFISVHPYLSSTSLSGTFLPHIHRNSAITTTKLKLKSSILYNILIKPEYVS